MKLTLKFCLMCFHMNIKLSNIYGKIPVSKYPSMHFIKTATQNIEFTADICIMHPQNYLTKAIANEIPECYNI